jgi:hypothetical protein
MTTYVNKPLGFIMVIKRVPNQPFTCVAVTMRCACCGSLKPFMVNTLGMN